MPSLFDFSVNLSYISTWLYAVINDFNGFGKLTENWRGDVLGNAAKFQDSFRRRNEAFGDTRERMYCALAWNWAVVYTIRSVLCFFSCDHHACKP